MAEPTTAPVTADCVCGTCDLSACLCDCHGVVDKSATVIGGRRLSTAPVTAEGARERVAAAIEARVKASILLERPPYDGSVGLAHFVGASFHDLADVALAALAGDPGDLPAQMAEAIDSEHNPLEPFDAGRLAAAAMSVRWEHAARQAAEVERLRAELARIRRAITDVYGDYDGEDLPAEVERLMRHLCEYEADTRRIIAAKNEGFARAEAERDALTTELGHAKGALTDARGEIDALTEENRRQREEPAKAEAAVERVETYLEGIETHCSANRLDVPSWVGSVRAALSTEATTTPARETA